LNIRRMILLLLLFVFVTVAYAQETETFTSDLAGNLILEYPSDWDVYDSREEFVTVVARGEVSINNDLEPGQAALLLLTPQTLESIGLPSNSADSALRALVGEIPEDAEIAEFTSEYGDGTRYDFDAPDQMSFTIMTFDRDGVPLIALIGMNDAEQSEVDELIEVARTTRYSEGAFDGTSVLLSQLIIDPTYGYSYEIPASWEFIDNGSYTVRGSDDVATILLLNPDLMEDPDAVLNFETVIQDELELVAEEMADQTEVVVEDGEDINGFPTQEVLMTLEVPSDDGSFPPFEYRFILVDYGDNQVLLSAVYSETFGATESYLPALRAVAESVFYAPIYPLAENIEHAGLSVPYPSEFTADTSNENQLVLTSDETTITVNNVAQNTETFGDVATEALADFANAVAQELTDNTVLVQPVPIGTNEFAHIFTRSGEDGLETYVFVTADNGDNILLVATHTEENFEDIRQIVEAIGSQLTVIE